MASHYAGLAMARRPRISEGPGQAARRVVTRGKSTSVPATLLK